MRRAQENIYIDRIQSSHTCTIVYICGQCLTIPDEESALTLGIFTPGEVASQAIFTWLLDQALVRGPQGPQGSETLPDTEMGMVNVDQQRVGCC